jgi:hypothetical protein
MMSDALWLEKGIDPEGIRMEGMWVLKILFWNERGNEGKNSRTVAHVDATHHLLKY